MSESEKSDPYGDGHNFAATYIERRQRCRAIRLNYANVWDVAAWLSERGYRIDVISDDEGRRLQITKDVDGSKVTMTASANDRDAIVLSGDTDLHVVLSRDFTQAWELDE